MTNKKTSARNRSNAVPVAPVTPARETFHVKRETLAAAVGTCVKFGPRSASTITVIAVIPPHAADKRAAILERIRTHAAACGAVLTGMPPAAETSVLVSFSGNLAPDGSKRWHYEMKKSASPVLPVAQLPAFAPLDLSDILDMDVVVS